MSKAARSGLRTITRDFSESSVFQLSDIDWPPTQPMAPAAPMTASQRRLKAIRDALEGIGPQIPHGCAIADSNIRNKRPNLNHQSDLPLKRPRPSPPSSRAEPKHEDPLSAPSLRPHPSLTVGPEPPSRTVPSASKAPDTRDKLAKIFLSQEQLHILKLVQDGHNVFYTGSAGTGKSVLLKEIIKTLRRQHVRSPDAVAITASTGIAACNIGGVTIHSFSGIGLGIESAEELASKIRKNKKATARWLRTKVLIIDEISMVEGDLFDKLFRIGCILRRDVQPFGGIQVIVTGDFFQLPPVDKGGLVKFAFEANSWKQTIPRTFNLTKVFRQRDQEFIDMLNEMRFGKLSAKSIVRFKGLSRPIEYEDGLGATELFPLRGDVDRSNNSRISRLSSPQYTFKSLDGGTITDEQARQKMLSNFMSPQILSLRVDAQVMLIKNVDETLVNGSMGRVLRFVDPAVYGTELDDEAGIGSGVIGAQTVQSMVGSATKRNNASTTGLGKLYPVVEFILPNGGRRTFLVLPEVWKVELPNGEVQVSRSQLPLILAWAMSIHKSQGQTLDRVKVDLGKVFEKGQAYVALSRATSLEGLQVLNFDPRKVMAHPKVAEWSKSLETVEDN